MGDWTQGFGLSATKPLKPVDPLKQAMQGRSDIYGMNTYQDAQPKPQTPSTYTGYNYNYQQPKRQSTWKAPTGVWRDSFSNASRMGSGMLNAVSGGIGAAVGAIPWAATRLIPDEQPEWMSNKLWSPLNNSKNFMTSLEGDLASHALAGSSDVEKSLGAGGLNATRMNGAPTLTQKSYANIRDPSRGVSNWASEASKWAELAGETAWSMAQGAAMKAPQVFSGISRAMPKFTPVPFAPTPAISGLSPAVNAAGHADKVNNAYDLATNYGNMSDQGIAKSGMKVEKLARKTILPSLGRAIFGSL